jgi:hypothetical protein
LCSCCSFFWGNFKHCYLGRLSDDEFHPTQKKNKKKKRIYSSCCLRSRSRLRLKRVKRISFVVFVLKGHSMCSVKRMITSDFFYFRGKNLAFFYEVNRSSGSLHLHFYSFGIILPISLSSALSLLHSLFFFHPTTFRQKAFSTVILKLKFFERQKESTWRQHLCKKKK